MRFGEKASSYLNRACIQKEVARWCSDWIRPIEGNMRVVEYGAGPGVFTEYLVEAGIEAILATDASVRMVNEGRLRLPGVKWKVEDAWNPEQTELDRVYSCSLLQWASDPVDVLKKWRATLKPGGVLLATVFVEKSMMELLEIDPGIAAFEWRSDERWLQFFEESGFIVKRSESKEVEMQYDDGLAALRSIHGIGAVSEGRFGPSRLRNILKAIDFRYQNVGAVPLTWRSMKVEAIAP